jgi:hypothetical protein
MDVLEEIAKLLKWYDANYRTATAERLIYLRVRLSTLSYNLGQMLVDAKSSYNARYFIRKISVSRSMQGLVNDKQFSIKIAEEQAKTDNESKLKEEVEAESSAYGCEVLLRQCNRILDTLNQQISFLRKEEEISKTQV